MARQYSLRRVPRSPTYPRTFTVTLTEPIGVARTSEPVEVRCSFREGEVPTADYLTVLDPDGTEVEFQWEPAENPLDRVQHAAWLDGSLKWGSLWFFASLAANEAKTYTVRVYDAAQSHSFTQTVTYLDADPLFSLSTSKIKYSFETGQVYSIRRMYHLLDSNWDIFSGVNGFHHEAIFGADTKQSFVPTDVDATADHGRIGSTAFGYGVVFQDWHGKTYRWVSSDVNYNRFRFRVFGNSRVRFEHKHWVTGGTSALTAILVRTLCRSDTTKTYVTNGLDATCEFAKANGGNTHKLMVCHDNVVISNDATTSETYTQSTNFATADTWAFGYTSGDVLPDGAIFYNTGWLSNEYSGTYLNERLKCLHPVVGWAAPAGIGLEFSAVRDLAAQYQTLVAADTNYYFDPCSIFMRTVLGELTPAQALTAYLAWGTAASITLSSASSVYTDGWAAAGAASRGMQFWGRNFMLLPYLHSKGVDVDAYMVAIADMVVQVETESGADGTVWLSDANHADTYNGAAAGLYILAATIDLVGTTAGRTAAYARIKAKMAAGYQDSGLWLKDPESVPQTAVNKTIFKNEYHYHAYTTALVLLAGRYDGSITTTRGWLSWCNTFTTSAGYIREWMHNDVLDSDPGDQRRRGVINTYMLTAAAFALFGEKQAARVLIEHMRGRMLPRKRAWLSQHDNWTKGNSTPITQGQDLAFLAAALET